jgi:hypothetical protein
MNDYGIDADELAMFLGISEEIAEEKRHLNKLLDDEIKSEFLSCEEYYQKNYKNDNVSLRPFEEYVQVAINTPGYFKRYKNKENMPIFLIYNLCQYDIHNLEIFFDLLTEYQNGAINHSIKDFIDICINCIDKGFSEGISEERSLLHKIIIELSQETEIKRPLNLTLHEGYPGFRISWKFGNFGN